MTPPPPNVAAKGVARDDPGRMIRIGLMREPQSVVASLARLRWLAVVGQISATLIAQLAYGVDLPVVPILAIILTTALTNVALQQISKRADIDARVLPAVSVLDVVLLTLLLALTGASRNPFCSLYIVHVVLAVLLLNARWTWVIAGLCSACYLLLYTLPDHLRDVMKDVPNNAIGVGSWAAVTLDAVIIAYFVGNMHRTIIKRDKQLATLRERNERSARFAAVTALAAGAAHELGSPLGTIAVVSKELEISVKQLGVSEDVTDDCRLIRTEVDRCRAILDRMRLEVGDDLRYQTRVVTAAEFVDEAKADLIEERKPRVIAEWTPAAERFYLSSRAILRAVSVLLRNGFEASPANATVRIKLDHDGRNVICDVIDRGGGMPAEVLKRAGEPFFTTKEMGRGMGMGLFLVKLVIENNDGHLELQSTPGQGTLARLTFPATRPADAPAVPSAIIPAGA